MHNSLCCYNCSVLQLPMKKIGLSQEYRQSSKTYCPIFCKVQSIHASLALICLWICSHRQIWFLVDIPRGSCKSCGLQSNSALDCRGQGNMIENREPIFFDKPIVISEKELKPPSRLKTIRSLHIEKCVDDWKNNFRALFFQPFPQIPQDSLIN